MPAKRERYWTAVRRETTIPCTRSKARVGELPTLVLKHTCSAYAKARETSTCVLVDVQADAQFVWRNVTE